MREYPQYSSQVGFCGALVFTWTGFYVRAQVGYAWGEDETVSAMARIVFDGVGGLQG